MSSNNHIIDMLYMVLDNQRLVMNYLQQLNYPHNLSYRYPGNTHYPYINPYINQPPTLNTNTNPRNFARLIPRAVEISVLRRNTTSDESHRSITSNTTIELFNNEENDICTICRQQFNDRSIIRKINVCGHYFHQGCIDTWYSEKYKCPICNQDVR